MDSLTPHMAPLVLVLFLLSRAASDSDVERVKPGEDATLPCRTAVASIRAVEWTRTDLKSSEYVLLYSDGRSDPTHQHPDFEGRVQLVDSELKNGNVSLTLKNVSSKDIGTYECRVAGGGLRRRKRAIIKTEPIRTIQLVFTESGSRDGNQEVGNQEVGNQEVGNQEVGNHTPTHLGVVGSGLFCFSVVGLFLGLKYRRRMNNPGPAAAVEAV